MSTEYDLIAHRKWALEFLAKLNPGKPFDGDVFEDADALVAYVTEGHPRQQIAVPISEEAVALWNNAEQELKAINARYAARTDPFDVNTGLAQ